MNNVSNLNFYMSQVLTHSTESYIKSNNCSHFYSSKIFLCYDSKNKEWSEVSLNIIQQFLRKVFGCYKNTHSQFIYQQWGKEYKNRPPFPDIEEKIFKICQKNIICLTNCNPEEAEIVCFANNHIDNAFRRGAIDALLKRYRTQAVKDNIILIEGLKVSRKISADAFQKHFKFTVGSGIKIQGWEPENLDDLTGKDLFSVTDKEEDKGDDLIDAIEKKFSTFNKNDHREFDQLLSFVKGEFTTQFTELAKFFLLSQSEINKELELIISSLNKAYSIKEKLESINEIITQTLTKAIDRVLSNYHKAKYHYVKPEIREVIHQGIAERTASLANEIAKQTLSSMKHTSNHALKSPKRRIFVIAGTAHILHCDVNYRVRNKKDWGVEKLHEILGARKFAIYVSKDRFHKYKKHNLHLKIR